MTRRVVATALLVAVVGAGLCVHLLLAHTALSDIAGDALYALAVYLVIVAVAPRLPPLLVGAIGVARCVAVELFQLTGLPLRIGGAFAPAMLVLGTVFDPRDLLVYVVTGAAATAADLAVRRITAARSPQAAR